MNTEEVAIVTCGPEELQATPKEAPATEPMPEPEPSYAIRYEDLTIEARTEWLFCVMLRNPLMALEIRKFAQYDGDDPNVQELAERVKKFLELSDKAFGTVDFGSSTMGQTVGEVLGAFIKRHERGAWK